ncbi:MAG: hypothetical protein AABZ08_10000 [Planctomycetota bacterium]
MKAERRQELRTNELAQQIDHAGDYMKQNAATLATVVILATAVVAGAFWFIRGKQTARMEAWGKLSQSSAMIDSAVEPLDKYKAVADENLDPVLTVQAHLKTGMTAYTELGKARASGKEPGKNFAQIAEESYTKALSLATTPLAIGQAMIGLGLLAEDKGDLSKAKEWYQKIITDKNFDDSAIKLQAQFRLENMDKWAVPVVFAAPPPPASQPTSAAADPGALMPSGLITPTAISADQVPDAVKNLARDAAKTPTTQPAGN